ncbi:MAG TPA: hypothetical protein VFA71_00040, partial [Terriglobales bacterium]|nr:hypothetical protein [Terriglobales bacterium]
MCRFLAENLVLSAQWHSRQGRLQPSQPAEESGEEEQEISAQHGESTFAQQPPRSGGRQRLSVPVKGDAAH